MGSYTLNCKKERLDCRVGKVFHRGVKLRWKVMLLCLTCHSFSPTLCLLWQLSMWEKETGCFFSLRAGLHSHKPPTHLVFGGEFLLDLLIGCILFLLLLGEGPYLFIPFPQAWGLWGRTAVFSLPGYLATFPLPWEVGNNGIWWHVLFSPAGRSDIHE